MRVPLALFCLFVSANALWAQTLALRAEVGLTRSSLHGGDFDWGARDAPVLGLQVRYWPWDHLGVEVGGLLHDKGSQVPDIFRMRLTYLEAPLLLRLRIGARDWALRPALAAGWAPARELSCALASAAPTLDNAVARLALRAGSCRTQRTDPWDFGTIIEAGVEVRALGRATELRVRKTTGVHNIASGYRNGFPFHNRAVTVLIATPLISTRPSN